MSSTTEQINNVAVPIPYGWYCVAYSDELSVAEINPLRYFGEDLVLYRNQQGVACFSSWVIRVGATRTCCRILSIPNIVKMVPVSTMVLMGRCGWAM